MSPLKPSTEENLVNREVLQKELEGLQGPRYWRSLEELADTPEFQEFLHREFPANASEWTDPVGRRTFLRLMGASLALAGVAGCVRQPPEKIVPFVRQPEELIPGRPLFFATAIQQQGIAHPVLVESHMGRPTKIEGNPEHPVSSGATNLFTQASILELYDPDRSQVVLRTGRIRTWDDFLQELGTQLATQEGKGGSGLRLLTPTVTSPCFGDLLQRVLERFPNAKWHQWEACGWNNQRLGSQLAFGSFLDPRHDFTRAEVILSLDSDFLFWGGGAVEYARQFTQRRRQTQNRLYLAEPTPSVTGTMADHRLAASPAQIQALAQSVAASLGAGMAQPDAPSGASQEWLRALLADLQQNRGNSLILAGESQPPWVHALVHRLNEILGNVGNTLHYIPSIEVQPVDQVASLRDLTQAMRAGSVDMLLLLGGNPVYDAPAELNFSQALEQVPFRMHLSPSNDETSNLCHWHIPESHSLEAWSDARAADGSVTICQPLCEPLYNSKSKIEILAALIKETGKQTRDLVREYWQGVFDGADFENRWEQSVHDGRVAGSEFAAVDATSQAVSPRAGSSHGDLELVFQPDPSIFDGRYANNGWLQEVPKPITKLTWDNAVLIAPSTAGEYALESGDVVEITSGDAKIEGPVWILPGQAAGTLTLHLGYGRRRSGRVGSGTGFDVYPLRRSDGLAGAAGSLRKTGRRATLVSTQGHYLIAIEASREAGRRHLIREATLARYREEPDVIREMGEEYPEDFTLYPPHPYPGHAWGMAVDLNACTGCNACVIACQSENNIPVVGKEQVEIGREMQWMRIDRYFSGSVDAPQYRNQPMFCQHCENAPCEVVCPVGATTHSDEGLNEMTYNRCVGTRYCSNNCPYKVRRFNFLLFQDWTTPSLKLMRNPDVSIRSRGVMEKCTYCVQRINAARIDARVAGREIRDGDIVTACQAVCPSQALLFGDINDPGSRVSEWKSDPRNYSLLTEVNTKPRTTYLARLTNPNPELADE